MTFRRCPHLLAVLLCLAWPQTSLAGEEVKLAVLTELSGPYASVGTDCIAGLKIALHGRDEHSNPKLQLLYDDTRNDPTTAISSFHKMLADPRVLAFFTTFTKIALPLNPLSKQSNIVLLATSGHPAVTDANPYAFRFFPSAKMEAAALAAKALEMGQKRAAVLTLQEEWNEALSDEFVKSFEAGRGSIVYDGHLAAGENDFSPYIPALRASRADAVLVNLTFGQIGAAVKKLREQGLRQQIFSSYRLQYKENYEIAGAEALEGAVFFEVSGETQPRFQALLKSAAPNAASSVAFVCYSALGALMQALKNHPDTESREQLYRAMLETTEVELLDGRLTITDREAQYHLSPRVMRGGVPATLE